MSRIMQLGRTGIGWRAGALFCAVAIALATLAATAAAAGASTAPAGSGLRSGRPHTAKQKVAASRAVPVIQAGAALVRPQLFTEELRAAFRSLR